jgi:hypothetical protein
MLHDCFAHMFYFALLVCYIFLIRMSPPLDSLRADELRNRTPLAVYICDYARGAEPRFFLLYPPSTHPYPQFHISWTGGTDGIRETHVIPVRNCPSTEKSLSQRTDKAVEPKDL